MIFRGYVNWLFYSIRFEKMKGEMSAIKRLSKSCEALTSVVLSWVDTFIPICNLNLKHNDYPGCKESVRCSFLE